MISYKCWGMGVEPLDINKFGRLGLSGYGRADTRF